MVRVALVVVGLALTIYAVADCVRTPAESMPARIPKAMWIILALLFFPIGSIAWIIVSRVSQAEENEGKIRRTVWSSSTPDTQHAGVHAPDDDPEFLWKLEKQIREERARRHAEDHDDDSATDREADEDDSESPNRDR